MSRIDVDEVWEKRPDGTMNLISRVERVVSDEQEARERRPDRLRAQASRPINSLTPIEKDELLELLIQEFLGL